jgi:hypothetical protein
MNPKWIVAPILIGSLCISPAFTLEGTPPESLVDKGACPFECCTYRTWYVDEETEIREKPEMHSKIITTVGPGEAVEAITGEVHVSAGKFSVRKAFSRYVPGDRLWIYTYLGEGFFKVWFKGRYYEEDFGFSPQGTSAYTSEFGRFEKEPVSVWWVLIKTEDGEVGWTENPDNFSNKDACS